MTIFSGCGIINKHIDHECERTQKYPSGSRGSPAKGVVRETVARVQIPPSAPYRARRLEKTAGFLFIESCGKRGSELLLQKLQRVSQGGIIMKIMVAGLGLIGGSIAKSLKRAGHFVDGIDRQAVCERAKTEGVIVDIAQDFLLYDLVFVALPPDAVIDFINGSKFKDGAIVADICGVKGAIAAAVGSMPRNFRYVGCHPMAGKEVSGLENSSETLFDDASMIIVEGERTDREAVALIEALCAKMGFSNIKHCDAKYHDKKIAYTSQLAHIVSNAYVKSPTADGFFGFTGGSFQDMTRIAGVDEEIWSRLFMMNSDAVEEELARLISNLQEYLGALRSGDEKRLKELLREGRLRKEDLDKERKIL